MKCSHALVMLLALSLCVLVPMPRAMGADVQSVQVLIPGETARTSQGLPSIVAGVLHSFEVSVSAAPANVTVVGHLGWTPPSTANDSNSYEWSAVGTTSIVWRDVKYGSFINASQCSASGVKYVFAIGLSASAKPGLWNFTVFMDGTQKWGSNMTVEAPNAGFALSRPDFFFTLNPFQTTSVSSYNPGKASYYVRSNNMGNVPLNLTISYDPFNAYFSTTNNSKLFHIGEQRYHYISFSAPSWSPRTFTVHGKMRGEPKYLITKATVALVPAFEQDFTINVTVKRTGYALLDFGSVQVQYVETVFLPFNNQVVLNAYFTGTGAATLSLEGDNVTINRTTLDDAVVNPGSIQLTLTNSTESHLQVTIFADQARASAFNAHLIYKLTSSSLNKQFATGVTVGAMPTGYKAPTEVNWLIVILVVVAVALMAAFMAVYAIRKRKERSEQRSKSKKGRGKSRR